MGDGKKVGWCIVGLGEFATEQVLPAFANTRHSRLAGFATGDPDEASGLATAHGIDPDGIYTYDDFDRIADNPDIDVAYIIVPTALHADFTIKALRAGKHVLCEKPMATNVADCDAMIEAARQADRKLMVAYRAQFEPHNKEAIRRIRAGEIGAVRHVEAVAARVIDSSSDEDWRLDKARSGGGALMDIGIYALNAARYLVGEEPDAVSAVSRTDRRDPRFGSVEDRVFWRMEFPGRAVAHCATGYTFEANRFAVHGEKGALVLEPATEYGRKRLFLQKDGKTREIPVEGCNEFAAEIDHFSECVLAGREPRTGGAEGRRDIALIERIYDAAGV